MTGIFKEKINIIELLFPSVLLVKLFASDFPHLLFISYVN